MEDTEAVLPAEVNVSDVGSLKPKTNESAVRQIGVQAVTGPDDKRVPTHKNLIYKRLHEGSFTAVDILGNTREQKLLTPEQALELAKEKQAEYDNFLFAYGPTHVAKTEFVVGSDQADVSRPQVHVYQEPVDDLVELPMLREGDVFAQESIQEIRGKSLDELDPTNPRNPREGYMRDWIQKHQRALQDFYPAYVEGALLGLFPDIKIIGGHETDAGLLFTSNAGIKHNADGTEAFKVFDFGKPRMDALTLESRRRLKQLIDEHKKAGELPIYSVTRIDEYNGEPKFSHTRTELADWYEAALRQELSRSLDDKVPYLRFAGSDKNIYTHAFYETDKERQVDIVFDDIEAILINPYHDTGEKGRLHFELESFQRLSHADPYHSPLVVTRRNTFDENLNMHMRVFRKVGDKLEYEVVDKEQ